MGRKVCRDCGEDKPAEEFYVDRTAADGRRGNCKSCQKAYVRKRYDENPVQNGDRRAIAARYRERHPEAVRAQNIANLRKRRVQMRQTVQDLLGNCCARCGTTENLQLDHMREDGAEHRARLNNNHDLMLREAIVSIQSGEGRYQLLCQPHNLEKHWEHKRAEAI